MSKNQIPMTKLFFFLLFSIFLLFAFRGEVRAGDLIYGDAERDSSIDAVDLLRIRQNAGGYPGVPLLGNANAAGRECELAVVDALAIRQYLLGFRPDLPVFNPPACWAIGLTATDGDGQVGVPDQTLPQPLEVTLNNIPACTQTLSGCTLGGATITYEITSDTTGGATLPGSVTTLDIDTDSSGNVSTLLTMGSGPGTVTIVANIDLHSAEGGPLTTVSAAFTAVAVECDISSVGPATGCPGDSVTIVGTKFGETAGSVSFDATPATVISWGDTSIVVSAPGGDYVAVAVTPTAVGECSLAGSYSYDNQAPTGLAATPAGGSYCATMVSLSASDGIIYYATDGSGPTTASPVYSGSIDISVDTTLKFMAVDTCGNQSGTVTELYDIDNESPTGLAADPAGGSYCATAVSLGASDGAIYYTTDGSGPTTGSPVYVGPIDISGDTTLKFMAEDVCGNQSNTITEVYDIDDESPTGLAAFPAGGSYCATPVTVSLSASDGTIYCTTDGSDPTTSSPVYAGPIDISGDTTLKFMAVDTCGNQAGTVTEVYDIDTEAAVTITEPVNGVTVGTGDVQVTGTADSDISSVSLGATQGTWTDTNPSVSGGAWSSTLQDLAAGPLTITATGTDNCGNTGNDSVTVNVPHLPICMWNQSNWDRCRLGE